MNDQYRSSSGGVAVNRDQTTRCCGHFDLWLCLWGVWVNRVIISTFSLLIVDMKGETND